MKRGRRHVRCTICTTYRWLGNNKGRFKAKDELKFNDMKEQIRVGVTEAQKPLKLSGQGSNP